jgi:hypothetical protein
VQKGLPFPAFFGMKQLPGTPPDEGRAACARRLAIGTLHHPLNVGVEMPGTAPAEAQLILRIHVIAAPGANESTRSLRVIDIEPITACPAFVHLDTFVAVIHHIRRTAFAAHHLPSPLVLSRLFTMLHSLDINPVHDPPLFSLPSFFGYPLEAARS